MWCRCAYQFYDYAIFPFYLLFHSSPSFGLKMSKSWFPRNSKKDSETFSGSALSNAAEIFMFRQTANLEMSCCHFIETTPVNLLVSFSNNCSHVCFVFISVAPEIRPVPSDGVLIVKEGEPASLSCEIVKGSPTPEITWRRKVRFFCTFCNSNDSLKWIEACCIRYWPMSCCEAET